MAPPVPVLKARIRVALRHAAVGSGIAALAAAPALVVAPDLAWGSLKLAAAYLATPVAKEAWLAVAPVLFGLPLLLAAAVMLAAHVAVVLVVLHLVPRETAMARAPRLAAAVAAVHVRLRRSALARHSTAAALGALLLLPFHGGGAVLGTIAGCALGLRRRAVFAAVVGAGALRIGVVFAAVWGAGVAWA